MSRAVAISVAAIAAGLVVLGACGAEAWPRFGHWRPVSQSSKPSRYFTFAPIGGAGLGGACSCSAVSANIAGKMTAGTFTRDGGAFCTVGNTQAVTPGNLIACGSNQPRVMPGLDGTGPLKVLIEHTASNEATFPEDFDNAAWTKTGNPGAAPVVTKDFAQGPCGVFDGGACKSGAERVQFLSCANSGDFSLLTQGSLGSGTRTTTAYCAGVSAQKSISVCTFGSGTAAGSNFCNQLTCPAPTLLGPTYSDGGCDAGLADAGGPAYVFDGGCYIPVYNRNGGATTVVAGAGSEFIGCDNETAFTGNGNTGAADVLLWGAQYENPNTGNSLQATSYIPTTGARGAELLYFTAAPSSVSTGSMAISVILPDGGTGNNKGMLAENLSGANKQILYGFSTTVTKAWMGGTTGLAPQGTSDAGVANLAMWWDSSSTSTIFNGNTVNGAVASAATPDNIQVGGYNQDVTTTQDGLYWGACVDTDPSKCLDTALNFTQQQVVWVGDSLIHGECGCPGGPYGAPDSTCPPPGQLASMTGKTVGNYGIGGTTAEQCADRFLVEILPRTSATTLVWSCAVNSLLADESGTTTYNAAVAAWNAARAKGMKVVVTAVGPWDKFPSWNQTRGDAGEAYDGLANAWTQANGGLFVLTRPNLGGQGGDPAALLTSLRCPAYADNLHMSDGGYFEMALTVYDAGLGYAW